MSGAEVGAGRLYSCGAGFQDISKDAAAPAFCFCGCFDFDRFSWDCVGDENGPAFTVTANGFTGGSYVCQFDSKDRVHR